jgi:hypothetical protein
MKIRFIRQTTDGGETVWPGQEAEVSDILAQVYIAAGWAEPVTDENSSDEPAPVRKRGRPKYAD